MGPRKKPSDEVEPSTADDKAQVPNDEVEVPSPSQQDWDAIKGARILPDGGLPQEEVPGTTGIEKEGALPEEDDDNPYQESDEALPDDAEEAAIARDPARRGGPFDEV
ncbi:MAG: hypothetical protein EOS58_18375 [Mesorhizobium sp.]|uniref:hypothetical protein n=1 Tax=unclassified Mesorhizobium TaxID=325217 RepID=UPI000F75B1B7|nr:MULTISPECIES: hypothetical protein [unclassified Mesorhizobium]RVD67815.1 hypothetical protein EN751_34725 [Mesorhizobium sp. M4A.F.Ca.ET.029.04.2.1]AZO47923.1 hypothetical protein EJ073_08890 [Mesorhizobium sp. M4B.F.Ca.ET.058.02.1.1]RUX42447.1 hypothetical protein EOA33_31890 [Mesorhizobium sp. M4A.F.Ca.ET.050.02.1.1]RVC45030.1 hypothetical protein EN781_11515 [Mesorhizobium sp. M4A.F.Ca.ET.090.04.2.1]RVC80177.1 hypothetical protein EN745_13810 [Mesorhizobium sp. M4A.F.Ca.ET.022.05.2.1]